MDLVGFLGLLVGEHEVEGDLVGLVHHGAMAGNHLADVEVEDSRDVPQILLGAGDEFIGGVGLGGIGPEDDDVG